MKQIFFILLSLSTINSCRVYEKLTIDKVDYLGISPRIDGYYYNYNGKIDLARALFLYRNGVFLNIAFGIGELNSSNLSKNQVMDSLIQDFELKGYTHNTQYSWGLFQIDNSKLTIEKWLTGVGGSYPVGRYNGIFLNDTTLSLSISDHAPDINDPVKTFNFRFLSSKPDSTNRYIK